MRKQAFCLSLTGLLLTTPAYAGETVSGPPLVIDATTMTVKNRTVQLDNIISLKPGNPCTWKNQPLDCGVLATAGLKDLVAGSDVVCTQNTSGRHTCTAGGYDLAFGLIHAGWAVPTRTAPARYVNKMNRARKRKLGFWGATNSLNETIAVKLSDR